MSERDIRALSRRLARTAWYNNETARTAARVIIAGLPLAIQEQLVQLYEHGGDITVSDLLAPYTHGWWAVRDSVNPNEHLMFPTQDMAVEFYPNDVLCRIWNGRVHP